MKNEIEAIVGDIGKVIAINNDGVKVAVRIELKGAVSPLATSMKHALEEYIKGKGFEPLVLLAEFKKPTKPAAPKHNGAEGIGRIIAVASGKGGVGKSTVAAAIARELAARGEKVGVLDADIYGPSQPKLFGLEGAVPYATEDDMIVPPTSAEGIKISSIGFFVSREEALVWRGPMATTALKQLIHQTQWGGIDTLVVDLPPGTGDIHLSISEQLKLSGAIIVTTPSDLALADVVRGVTMLKHDNIAVPVMGLVNNMAYFTPDDAPEKRYFIFGDGKSLSAVAEEFSLPILAEVPICGVVGAPIDPAIFSSLAL